MRVTFESMFVVYTPQKKHPQPKSPELYTKKLSILRLRVFISFK